VQVTARRERARSCDANDFCPRSPLVCPSIAVWELRLPLCRHGLRGNKSESQCHAQSSEWGSQDRDPCTWKVRAIATDYDVQLNHVRQYNTTGSLRKFLCGSAHGKVLREEIRDKREASNRITAVDCRGNWFVITTRFISLYFDLLKWTLMLQTSSSTTKRFSR
jgi:hypothetical protein